MGQSLVMVWNWAIDEKGTAIMAASVRIVSKVFICVFPVK